MSSLEIDKAHAQVLADKISDLRINQITQENNVQRLVSELGRLSHAIAEQTNRLQQDPPASAAEMNKQYSEFTKLTRELELKSRETLSTIEHLRKNQEKIENTLNSLLNSCHLKHSEMIEIKHQIGQVQTKVDTITTDMHDIQKGQEQNTSTINETKISIRTLKTLAGIIAAIASFFIMITSYYNK